jgi:hypothetical protein
MVGMTRASYGHGAALLAALALLALSACSGPVISPLAPPPYRDEAPASFDATWFGLSWERTSRSGWWPRTPA